MKRKSYGFFAVLILLLGTACFSIARASSNVEYISAAGQQSLYKLTPATSRGMIYDCNMVPLVNRTDKIVAAAAPSVEAIAELNANLDEDEKETIKEFLEQRKPFVFELDRYYDFENIDVFQVSERYSDNQLAPHIIGYTDSDGSGVSGIELAKNEDLMRNYGEISVFYRIDPLGRVIPGDEHEVTNTMQRSKAGVVLTIDAMIQQKAQSLAKKLGKGCVIVTEAPNAEIRAVASVPDFSPNTLDEITNSEDAPLVNRAFSAYSPGSVFKLVVAAEAIENGRGGFTHICKGYTVVNGMKINCFGKTAHGKMTMETALENSCNSYFIQLAQRLDRTTLLADMLNMGFGKSLNFGESLTTQDGNLPETKEVLNDRAVSNLAIGQGELTVTPIQIAAFINAIAADGEYSKPSLIAGKVDEYLNFVVPIANEEDDKFNIMEKATARQLRKGMEAVIKTGTGTKAKPENIIAGVKTGTAQTGVYDGDDELNHYWLAGYISDKNGPRYSIVVFKESAAKNDGATHEVFKELSEFIAENIF